MKVDTGLRGAPTVGFAGVERMTLEATGEDARAGRVVYAEGDELAAGFGQAELAGALAEPRGAMRPGGRAG